MLSGIPPSYIEVADRALTVFAQNGLKPEKGLVTSGNLISDKIFKLLQVKSRFGIARRYIGGSIGKKTSLPDFDYDLVVLINDQTPPFDKVLDEFEDILMLAEGIEIRNLHKTAHSVQFVVDGLNFDLLPGTNFVVGLDLELLKGDADALAQKQSELALRKIEGDYRRNPGAIYEYSSSLIEAQVVFMEKQKAFVHELVRICKFWNKTLTLGAYVSGRSTIIELVATEAGRTEENNFSTPSILRAFRRFLGLMKDFDGLGIEFERPPGEPSYRTPTFRKPFIVEPANPFNNIADGVHREVREKFKAFAVETIARLENEVRAWSSLGYFPLQLLFEPQPRVMVVTEDFTEPKKKLFETVDTTTKFPSMIVRNETKVRGILEMQRNVKESLFVAVHALTSAGKPGITEQHVQDLATKQIERHCPGRTINWIPSSENHEAYDVTFEIPYADRPRAIRVSFVW